MGAGNPNGYTAGTDAYGTSIIPTSVHGAYIVDVEGVVACPTGSTTFTSKLFFDAASTVTTPQFSAPLIAAVAVGLVALALMQKKIRPTIPSAATSQQA